jgi:hypothetical protein
MRDDDFDLLLEFVRDEQREKSRGKQRYKGARRVRFGCVFVRKV